MREEDNIGKKIKSRLENHEFPVSGKLWENIHKNLPPEPVVKPTTPEKVLINSATKAYLLGYIATFSVATLVTIGIYLTFIQKDRENNITSVQTIKQAQQDTTKIDTINPGGINKADTLTDNIKEVSPIPNTPSNYNTDRSTSVEIKKYHQNTILEQQQEESREKSIETSTVLSKKSFTGKKQVLDAVAKQSKKSEVEFSNQSTEYSLPSREVETSSPIAQTFKSNLSHDDTSSREIYKNSQSNDIDGEKNRFNSLKGNIRQLTSFNNLNKVILFLEKREKIYDKLINLYSSNLTQAGVTLPRWNKVNPKTKALATDSESGIIPTKTKGRLSVADFSIDLLTNVQNSFTTTAVDSNLIDSVPGMQAKKAVLSGAVRINYSIPVRQGNPSKVTVSSGISWERIHMNYIHSHTRVKIDSAYFPVYEWKPSGPGGSDSIRVVVDSLLSTQISKQTSSYVQQTRATYIGIPLTGTYNLYKNNWSFYVTAGVQLNILLKNKSSIHSGDTLQYIPRVEEVSTVYKSFVPSLIGNAGVTYRFSEKLLFIVEPTFKYSLTSFQKDKPFIPIHPFVLGVNTGIRYIF